MTIVACSWDSGFMGSHVSLTLANLHAACGANQEWVRCTLGRDPATILEPLQWELDLPVAASTDNSSPGWGMVDEDRIYADGTPGYANIHAWSLGFGTAGLNADYSFHNSMVSVNWSGGSHGGQPHTMSFIWWAFTDGPHSAGDLDVYMDGVFLTTVAGVTSGPGKLMYPHFESGGSGAPGTFAENCLARFGATPFTYPDPGGDGAIAWCDVVAPPEPLPRQTTLVQSRAVSGAHALAQVSASVVAVAAYNSLQLVTFDSDTGIASLGAALALDYQLGDLAKVSTVLMSVGDDGYLHKFSTAPVETGSVAVKARYPWIAVAGTFAIVHAGGGQIGVYNTSLAKLAQHSTNLADVVYATADSAGNVYAFDGRGHGALLIVNLSTGALEFSSKFTVANAVGVRAAFVDEDAEELVIGCSVQSRVMVVNTATMGVTASEITPGKKLVGLVIGDPERRAIFETGNTEVFPDNELPLTAALTVAEDEVFFASSKMSAVGLYRTLLEE